MTKRRSSIWSGRARGTQGKHQLCHWRQHFLDRRRRYLRAYIVDNLVAPIMSVSFGECEQEVSQDEMDFYSDLWSRLLRRDSVFVSSGDAGSSMCDVPMSILQRRMAWCECARLNPI